MPDHPISGLSHGTFYSSLVLQCFSLISASTDVLCRQEEPFKMWDSKKLLLAAIVFTALCYKVTAKITKLLDMAPDAVDDQYDGCRKEAMEKFIDSGLLEEELTASEEFQRAWSDKTQCSKLIPGGIKQHTYALKMYVNKDRFMTTFNDAVETMGANVSVYENDFHFKSLHFLLMDSMKLLNPNPKKCRTVFFIGDYYTAKKGTNVRFGRFITGYSNYNILKNEEDLDGTSVFEVTSCFFANLGDNICSKDKDLVLLSPAEVFTVEEKHKVKDDDSEYTEIVLKHSKLESSHNCYIFSRSPADVSTQWLVMLLVALSLFFSNC